MFELDLIILLSVAFGLGMVHALDADHIAMVTSLSSGHSGFKKSFLYCSRWALGHALTLILLGIVVFFIGIQIPEHFSHYAEFAIAVFLILIGVLLLRNIFQQRLHLHFHHHDDLPQHAHWHSHQKNASHHHQHRAMFIGSVHGLAGSAPLLALIPLAVHQQPVTGMLYLLLFSGGVIVAMLVFGGLLSVMTETLARASMRLFIGFRLAISLASMVVGGLLMVRVLQ